jgi:hypothetical protein
MRIGAWLGLVSVSLAGCGSPKRWVAVPLPATMASWAGCYELDVASTRMQEAPHEAWYLVLASTVLVDARVKRDSALLATANRRAITISLGQFDAGHTEFGMWQAIGADSVVVRVVLGREGQGYSLRMGRMRQVVSGDVTFRTGGLSAHTQETRLARLDGRRAECNAAEAALATSAP